MGPKGQTHVVGGDNNSSFFHNSVRFRNHCNTISHILDANGNVFTDRDSISRIFMNHFSDLWLDQTKDNLQEIVHALPDDLPQVSMSEGDSLICTISFKEVHDALFSLPTGKSPGPDGLNVEFFRFYWNDIGTILFTAIQYFFENTVMPNAWGRTYITLIPKKPNPKCASDYRPISLCNVCYKIISKILANRLKNVLPNLIGKEQCGFVSGRTPFDNIITLQESVHSIENDTKSPLGC